MSYNPDRAEYPAAEEIEVCERCDRTVEKGEECPECGPRPCGECGQVECECDHLDELDEGGQLL